MQSDPCSGSAAHDAACSRQWQGAQATLPTPPVALDRTGGMLHTWETRHAPQLYAVRAALEETYEASRALRAAHGKETKMVWRIDLQDDAHLSRIVHATQHGGGVVDQFNTARDEGASIGMQWTPKEWRQEQSSVYALYDGRRVHQTTTLSLPSEQNLASSAAACRSPQMKQTLAHAAQALRACSTPMDTLYTQQALLVWLLANTDASQEVLANTHDTKPKRTSCTDAAQAQRQRAYMPVQTAIHERVVQPYAGNDVLQHVYNTPNLHVEHDITRSVFPNVVPPIVLPTACSTRQCMAVHVAWDGATVRQWKVHVERSAHGSNAHDVDDAFRTGQCSYALVLQLSVGATEEPSTHLVQMALRMLHYATNLTRSTSQTCASPSL